MSDEAKQPYAVMEGQGAYNRHATLPAGGAALAMPLLEKAAQSVCVEPDDQPVVIADYGSSQGKNSLAPLRVAIQTLRRRIGPERPVLAYHIDQQSNDFNSLFEVLDAHSDRYTRDDPNVFPSAIGRSFYEPVLPGNSVHLGWSSYAAVWLSRIPGPVPGHFIALASTGATRAAFAEQAARDWESFLSLRAREMRDGGRLVVVLPALDDDGTSGFEGLMTHVNDVLAELVHDGVVQADERARMVLGSYPRRTSDLLAPFVGSRPFRQLAVEHCQLLPLEDAAWADYRRDGDRAALASKHALFFRSIFVPSLASFLDRAADADVSRVFGDQIENRLKQRLTSQPTAMRSFVSVLVLAKQPSAG